MRAETRTVAEANNHGAVRPMPNAPPELVVYVSWRTPGTSSSGGRPARVRSAQSLEARSTA